MYLMSSLVDVSGKITIPHLNHAVDDVTDDERGLYADIDFDPVRLGVGVGGEVTLAIAS